MDTPLPKNTGAMHRAVQENKGYLNHLRTHRHLTQAAVVTLLLGSTCLTPGILPKAYALPQNGVVRHGDVDITLPDPDTMMLNQNTESAIIDWESFNLDAQDKFLVFQPTQESWLLNRVNGGTVSTILGEIQANGGLVLVNPNGITLGDGAQINAGSLIMTTSDISDENFLNRNFVFDRPGSPLARIWNKGELQARAGGLVALVAPGVENDGVITANLGRIAIGSGRAFTLDLYGDNLIRFGVPDEIMAEVTGDLIRNSGDIRATGGRILLTTEGAARAVDGVLNMDGLIEANSAIEQNGEIVLFGGDNTVLVSGTVEARGDDAGETGGDIDIRARQTGLMDGGLVDASGHSGGGRVAFGGDYQGGRTVAPDGFKEGQALQADATYVAPTAKIDVRAIRRGDGGIATVWADKVTRFLGEIDGRGGAEGGDGGFAEVSGMEQLIFEGTAMMQAIAKGSSSGTLLLDPTSITIGGVDTNITVTGGVFESSASGSFLSISTLAAQMDTNNVIITTGADSVGFIYFNSAFTHINNTNSLTLDAATEIQLNAPIDVGGDLVVNSGGNIVMNTGTVQAAGNMIMSAGAGTAQFVTNTNSATLAALDVAINGHLFSAVDNAYGLIISAPTAAINGSATTPGGYLSFLDLSAVTTAQLGDNSYIFPTGAFYAPTELVLTQPFTSIQTSAALNLNTVKGLTGVEDLDIATSGTDVTVDQLGVTGFELGNFSTHSVGSLTIDTGAELIGNMSASVGGAANLNGIINVGSGVNVMASTVSVTGTLISDDYVQISAAASFNNSGNIVSNPFSTYGGAIDVVTDSFTNTGLLSAGDALALSPFGNNRGRVSIETLSTPFVVGSGGTLTGADIADGSRINASELNLRTFNGDLTVNDAISHEGFLSLSASGNFIINAPVAATGNPGTDVRGVLVFDAVSGISATPSTFDVGSAQLTSTSLSNVSAEQLSFIADDGVAINTNINGFEELFINADKDFNGTGTVYLNAALNMATRSKSDVDVNGAPVTVNEGGQIHLRGGSYSIGSVSIDVTAAPTPTADEYIDGVVELSFTNSPSVVIDTGGDLEASELSLLGTRVRIVALDDITFNVTASEQQIELVADVGEFGLQDNGTGNVILGSSASITNTTPGYSIAFIGNDFIFNTGASITSPNIRIASFDPSFEIGAGGDIDGTELQMLSGDSLYMAGIPGTTGFNMGCGFPFPTDTHCFANTLTLNDIAAADFDNFTTSLFFAAQDIVLSGSFINLPALTGSDPFLFGNNILFTANDSIDINTALDASAVPSVKFQADADMDTFGNANVTSIGSFTGIDVTFDGYDVALDGNVIGNNMIIQAQNNATASNLSVASLSLDSALANLNGSVNGQTAAAAAIEVSFTGLPASGVHFMNSTLIPSAQPGATPGPTPTVEPTPEPTVEPTPEPTPGPTVEPTPEPTPPPTVEPTPEPTPTPVDDVTDPTGGLNGGASVDTTTPLDPDLVGAISGEAQSQTGSGSENINDELVGGVVQALGESGDGTATIDEILNTIMVVDQTLEQNEDTGENLDSSTEDEEEEKKEQELKNKVQLNTTGEGISNVEIFDPADSGPTIDLDDEEEFTSGAPCQC